MTRRIHAPAGGLALTALILLAGCGGGDADKTTDATTVARSGVREVALTLTDDGCTPATPSVPAGAVKIVVTNPSSETPNEVELLDGDHVLGEKEGIAPGEAGAFTLELQPGTYELDCLVAHAPGGESTLTVTGEGTQASAGGSESDDLDAAVATYRAYVEDESAQLVTAAQGFVAALNAGDVQKAKDLFGPARIHYEAIEPIAESFGDLDPQIDARVNDVEDPATWTGFHKIEQILWVKDTTDGTAAYAKKLLADIRKLDALVKGVDLQAAQIANGAVELLDEVAASKITGEEDRYSHTDLSDFQGNLSGALAAFDALEPVLEACGEHELVEDVEAKFAQVQKGLDRYKRNTALGFASYADLSKADRRTFAQQVTALAEPLSQVAGKVVKT